METLKTVGNKPTPTKNSQNGKTATVAKKTTTEQAKKVAETKAMIKSFTPTAEDRIKNAENFSILTQKFSHLKGKNEELKKFQISSDGSKEHLVLENASGFKLKVTNSNVLNKVVNLLQSELNTLLTNTENEVKNFVI